MADRRPSTPEHLQVLQVLPQSVFPHLFSAKHGTEPALCLCGLLLHYGIELVGGSVDLLASLAVLLLSLRLGFLELSLRVCAVGVELLCRLFSLGICLACLGKLVRASSQHGSNTCQTYVL